MLDIKQLSQKHAKTCPYCRDDFKPNSRLFACKDCDALIHQDCWHEHPSCMVCHAVSITTVKLDKSGQLKKDKSKNSRKKLKRNARNSKRSSQTKNQSPPPVPDHVRVGRERMQQSAQRLNEPSPPTTANRVEPKIDVNQTVSTRTIVGFIINIILIGMALVGEQSKSASGGFAASKFVMLIGFIGAVIFTPIMLFFVIGPFFDTTPSSSNRHETGDTESFPL